MRAVKEEAKIKITKNISKRYEKRSNNNKTDLLIVEGKFFSSKFLLGIK
jgi:proteasome assembly chaperone (PAC2) family protein